MPPPVSPKPSPKPSPTSQRLYETYRSGSLIRQFSPEEERRLRDPLLTHTIERYFPQDRNARVLDLGCGAGLLLAKARTMGYTNLAGVDASAEQVAAARAAGTADVEQGDLLTHLLGLAPGSVACVVAFDVLEHIPRPDLAAFLEAVVRVLRPGGRFVVHVPNGASPFGGRVVFGDLTHETVFTDRSLDHLLRAFGFADVICAEDRPRTRGWRGLVRRLGWRAIRGAIRIAIALETGDRDPGMVLSQTFFCCAVLGETAPGGRVEPAGPGTGTVAPTPGPAARDQK